MTANSDLKQLIRKRMLRTGESYTAARRHFLQPEQATMTQPSPQRRSADLDLPVERLQLTLRTTRLLEQRGVTTIGQLAEKTEDELAEIGIAGQNRIEIREVLASRGL